LSFANQLYRRSKKRLAYQVASHNVGKPPRESSALAKLTMSKRTRKIITILLLVAAFAPLRNNPKAPPTISQKEYEEIVKPAIRKSIHPSWGLPKEERVLLKVRTGFDFGGRSLLGIDIHFTSYRGHSIAVIPTYLAECFIEIDGEAWISKN
jgi:hypothetical protein